MGTSVLVAMKYQEQAQDLSAAQGLSISGNGVVTAAISKQLKELLVITAILDGISNDG